MYYGNMDSFDIIDEECFFTPAIKPLPGVSSTMSDYMQGWTEKRRTDIVRAQLRQHHEEQRELEARPQMRTRATTEAVLAKAANGYKHPVDAWRHHADRYKLARCSAPPSPAATKAAAAPARRKSEAACRRDVIARLYPFQGKRGSAAATGPAKAAAGAAREGAHSAAKAPAAATGPEGSSCGSTDRGDSRPASPTKSATSAASKPGHRRCCGQPKATWEYLSEMGTQQQRARLQPPRAESAPPIRPLPRSEAMLRDAATEFGKRTRPLCTGRAPPDPLASVPSDSFLDKASAKRSNASVQSAPRTSRGDKAVIQRLHEGGVQQRAIHDMQLALAAGFREAEELRECTFQPLTNHPVCDASALSSPARSGGQVGESLYARGMAQMRQRRLQVEEGIARRQEEEMRECSFRPATKESFCSERSARSAEAQASSRLECPALDLEAPPRSPAWGWGHACPEPCGAAAGAARLAGSEGPAGAQAAAVEPPRFTGKAVPLAAAAPSEPIAPLPPAASSPPTVSTTGSRAGAADEAGRLMQNEATVLAMLDAWRARQQQPGTPGVQA